jgi:hypothetical protein
MKRLIPLLILSLLLSGCISSSYDYNLSYSDNEIPIFPALHQKINISLPNHPNHSWILSLYGKDILLFTDQKSFSTTTNNTTTTFTSFIFTTIKEGQTMINIIEQNTQSKLTVDMFSIFVKVEE